jgi:hypothetical protein
MNLCQRCKDEIEATDRGGYDEYGHNDRPVLEPECEFWAHKELQETQYLLALERTKLRIIK